MKKAKLEQELKLLKTILNNSENNSLNQVIAELQKWWLRNIAIIGNVQYEYCIDHNRKNGCKIRNRYSQIFIDEDEKEMQIFARVFPSLVLERLEKITNTNYRKYWNELNKS
ncbi:MAG: hypothetical protein RBR14_06585 [Candidatus Cloacimonas acidaminovorans]|nr:hypothetical protein [Candidatus Cloacimonas acidaminovorans]